MNDITPNMQAYLDLVNDINHLFIGLEDEEPCDICDGCLLYTSDAADE